MENSIYTVDYFIRKFQAIPEDEIGTGSMNSHCALYHCGLHENNYPPQYKAPDEVRALIALFGGDPDAANCEDYDKIFYVNDGAGTHTYLGKTPKQRILKKLYEIKATQQPAPEVKERIVYVMVDSTVKELSGQLTNN